MRGGRGIFTPQRIGAAHRAPRPCNQATTAALLLRTAVVGLFVAALAEVELVRRSDRMTVIYLVDQSLSLPESQRQQMIDYVNRAIQEHRRRDDRAGVIVFGRDAAMEIAPLDEHVPFDRMVSFDQRIRMARKSLTLVYVGPVTTRSPIVSK